jgi:hypothetical protein
MNGVAAARVRVVRTEIVHADIGQSEDIVAFSHQGRGEKNINGVCQITAPFSRA